MAPIKSRREGKSDTRQTGLGQRRAIRRRAANNRSDARWQHILAAAAKVFHQTGYSSATLEDIAQDVGIDRASLYYYVGTKAELLTELLRQPIFEMTARLEQICAMDLPALDRIGLAVRQHMADFAENYPHLFIYLAESLHNLTRGTGPDDVVLNARRYADLFTALIREGQESGSVAPDLNPRLAMLGILGMCNWTHRWYHIDGPLTLTEIGEQFARLATDGIRATPGK